MLGIRAGIIDVTKENLSDLSTTSEANQWKIHRIGKVKATGVNQIFTIDHTLGYTPAFLSFIRFSGNAYYQLNIQTGANYADKNILSIGLVNIGDEAFYIIFKDFGA